MPQDKNKNIYIGIGILVAALLIWFFFIKKNDLPTKVALNKNDSPTKVALSKNDYTDLIEFLKNNIVYAIRIRELAKFEKDMGVTASSTTFANKVSELYNNYASGMSGTYSFESLEINPRPGATLFHYFKYYTYINIKTKIGNVPIISDAGVVDKNGNILNVVDRYSTTSQDNIRYYAEVKSGNTDIFSITVPLSIIVYDTTKTPEDYSGLIASFNAPPTITWKI